MGGNLLVVIKAAGHDPFLHALIIQIVRKNRIRLFANLIAVNIEGMVMQ
ncbi:hypothetical protein SDC9_97767 [bioreactor metagenome]|uniref:Uncharacterized protein n=1 Tax=bioreactor metagenome TaxID=1076179 RepID=A0A645AFH1_9ZZZZ